VIELSRREAFRVVAGGLTTGAGLMGGWSAMGSPVGGAPSVAAADGGPYRLFPEAPAQRPFGIVRDFSAHIRDRTDVKAELLYWLTDGRASFLGGAGRFQFLEPIIRPMYERAGIPIEFGFGLGMQESLFRNYSVSHANARGIWQMQWAGQRYGLRGGDFFDVVKSTAKQLEYIVDLIKVFAGNLELVLVDYNWGPGHRFARFASDPNAFQRIRGQLPAETRRFVPRVLAATAIGLASDRYGMNLPRLDTRTVEVAATRDLHHLELALLLNTDHWNLGNLNPRESVRQWFKAGETIRIPKALEEAYGGAEEHPLRSEFHSFVSEVFPAPGQEIRYVVKPGDTLGGIVRQFPDCGIQGPNHLMLYNGLTGTIIRPGQELVIPCRR
jgi:hypothetical protein